MQETEDLIKCIQDKRNMDGSKCIFVKWIQAPQMEIQQHNEYQQEKQEKHMHHHRWYFKMYHQMHQSCSIPTTLDNTAQTYCLFTT